MRLLLSALAAGAFAVGLLARPAAQPPAPGPEVPRPSAVIEVGGSGIKFVALEAFVKDGRLETAVRARKDVQASPILTKDGKLTADRNREAAKEVAYLFYGYVRGELRVPPNRVRVVLSSAFEKVPNAADLEKEIAAALADPVKYEVAVDKALDPAKDGPEVKFDRITVTDELTFLVRGLGLADRDEVVVIDVGSGNVKCGYYVGEGPLAVAKYHVLTDGPPGTKALSNAALAEVKKSPGTGYLAALEKAAAAQVREPIEVSAAANPGMKTRTKYYLLGGAVWAMSTLTDPAGAAGASEFIPLKADDFKRYQKLVAPPGPGPLRAPAVPTADLPAEVRKAVEAEVKRVGEVFTPEQLASGAAILASVSEALDLADPRKALFTVRNGQFTWATAYLRAQADKEFRPFLKK